jgi:hypothetical protein
MMSVAERYILSVRNLAEPGFGKPEVGMDEDGGHICGNGCEAKVMVRATVVGCGVSVELPIFCRHRYE